MGRISAQVPAACGWDKDAGVRPDRLSDGNLATLGAVLFFWQTNRSRGVWRSSFFLEMLWLLTKLGLLLLAAAFVIVFLFYALTGAASS